jgi:hypothetical protein
VIKASVEVRSGAARFRVAVLAKSIEQAISLVGARYSGCEAEVLFPIDPETFFVKGPVPASGMVRLEAPEEAAGEPGSGRTPLGGVAQPLRPLIHT